MAECWVRQPACIAFSVTLLLVCDKGRVMTPSKKASGHDSPPEGYPKDRDQYADPANYKYPIDTAEHVRAAWDYIHVAKNRREYNLAELAYMERRIKSAALS